MNKEIKEFLGRYYELSFNDDEETREMLGDAVDLLLDIKEERIQTINKQND